MHYAAVSLVGLQVSNESTLLLSLAVDRLRTVLAVKGSLRRAEDGAPLTAPGRSEEPYLIRRERRIGKSMTLTAQHLATFNRRDHVRATKPRGTCTAAGGWMPKISRRPARGRDCSLDIPFYRTGRLDTLPRTERFAKLEWPAAGMTLRLESALVTRSSCLLFQFRRIEAFSFLPDV